ncbi:hypothetical protein F2Q70_00002947 [Brassica cretica]|uniref:Uncharacterized protein n=1 Tax=Brassica cretica TaxID=69181 RepID=A0A8S9J2G7_BRACR|nr:hypothetical protein F2Q70_00002947 [Brassica cretica]
MVSQIVWLGVKDVFTQIAKDVVGQGLDHGRRSLRGLIQTQCGVSCGTIAYSDVTEGNETQKPVFYTHDCDKKCCIVFGIMFMMVWICCWRWSGKRLNRYCEGLCTFLLPRIGMIDSLGRFKDDAGTAAANLAVFVIHVSILVSLDFTKMNKHLVENFLAFRNSHGRSRDAKDDQEDSPGDEVLATDRGARGRMVRPWRKADRRILILGFRSISFLI